MRLIVAMALFINFNRAQPPDVSIECLSCGSLLVGDRARVPRPLNLVSIQLCLRRCKSHNTTAVNPSLHPLQIEETCAEVYVRDLDCTNSNKPRSSRPGLTDFFFHLMQKHLSVPREPGFPVTESHESESWVRVRAIPYFQGLESGLESGARNLAY